uniref:Uncharacterized protein n=1 Tax=Aegilops tauschii subsp. strangulata TaxID=200361 RepID=A0A453ESE0_AEGTS
MEKGMGSHTSQGRWFSDIKRRESRASHCKTSHVSILTQIAKPAVCLPPTVFIFLSALMLDLLHGHAFEL